MLATALIAASGAVEASAATRTMSATQLFVLADRMQDEHRVRDAQSIYDSLSHDLDPEIRAEARFREGMMLAALKRYRQAAALFRALLDEKPGATRVRLELARVLAAMGDAEAARRELRQARATGLPPEVAIAVDRFGRGLPNTRRFGGTLEVAVLPDTNINRATQARTLDTIVAPLTLSRDARAHTGLGAQIAGQAYARLPLGDQLWLVPRVATQGNVYGQGQFNDISSSALLGLEWDVGRDRLSPAIGQTWRWYGGSLYARTTTLTMDWLHPSGPKSQFDIQAGVARARFDRNPLQDGNLYNVLGSYDRALGLRSGVSASADVVRQTASDPGYATWSGGGNVLLWRTVGAKTLFVSAGLHRLEGDARLSLFSDRRREWLYQFGAGATFRKVQLWGLAPLVRVGYERNRSTVGLYDYHRTSGQIGVTRAF